MTCLSFFSDPNNPPDEAGLSAALGNSFEGWERIRNFALGLLPVPGEEWKFSGKNYGWGFRVKNGPRNIIYLTPAQDYFFFSVVFGSKATVKALNTDICAELKEIINAAPVYAEGRGIRIAVREDRLLKDILKLIEIKIST